MNSDLYLNKWFIFYFSVDKNQRFMNLYLYLNKWFIVFFPVNKHHSIDGVNIKTWNYRPGKHDMDMQTF